MKKPISQLRLLGHPTKAMRQRAMDTLAQIGLAEKAHKFYAFK